MENVAVDLGYGYVKAISSSGKTGHLPFTGRDKDMTGELQISSGIHQMTDVQYAYIHFERRLFHW